MSWRHLLVFIGYREARRTRLGRWFILGFLLALLAVWAAPVCLTVSATR